eukprot:7003804-Pyramimonas_sp.AAC.1
MDLGPTGEVNVLNQIAMQNLEEEEQDIDGEIPETPQRQIFPLGAERRRRGSWHLDAPQEPGNQNACAPIFPGLGQSHCGQNQQSL